MARDAAFAALAEDIAHASEALLALIRENPDRRWHAYDLKMHARNGWSGSVMNLALQRLLADGAVEMEGDLVRLRQ